MEGVGYRRIGQVIVSWWPDGHNFLSVIWPINQRAGEHGFSGPLSVVERNPAPSAKIPFHPSPRHPKYGSIRRVCMSVRWSYLLVGWPSSVREGVGPVYAFRSESRPSSTTRTAAWVRSETPSLAIMRCTWVLTVERLTNSSREISRFVLP